MAKEVADLTTIDLFSNEKRPGRPKTNPLSRSVQIKINKRNQVKRDKNKGLKRIEFKIHEELYERLDLLAKEQDISRGKLIESLLINSLAAKKKLC
ncbi:MAG: LexA regulated protein [Alteromonadaceae bacterium]|nr:LexA regulated protein [Alteromonadaceae bacterium]